MSSDFSRFVSASPFPGLKRLSDPSSSSFARAAWAAFLAFSLGACAVIVQRNFAEWRDEPAAFELESVHHPVIKEGKSPYQ